MKRVLIVGDGRRGKIRKFSEQIHAWIKPLVRSVRLELDANKDLSRTRADCMIIIGGDGAILSAAARMKNNQIPALGIQMGRFGFLSELTPVAWQENLEKIIRGDGVVRERMRLACNIKGSHIKGRHIKDRGPGRSPGMALNDAVIASGSTSRMITVELEIDGRFVTAFHGDGVIVATPVGSTAYSLSAGGPIMEPSLETFIITPICSHAMAIRPLVVSAERTICLRPNKSRNMISLTLDGQRVHKIQAAEEVLIKRAALPFPLIRIVKRSYFETLRQKFLWGGTLIKTSLPARKKNRDGLPE